MSSARTRHTSFLFEETLDVHKKGAQFTIVLTRPSMHEENIKTSI